MRVIVGYATLRGGPENDDVGCTACQSGSALPGELSMIVTAPPTLAAMTARLPAPLIKAIFVPSGEYAGSVPATLRFVTAPPVDATE